MDHVTLATYETEKFLKHIKDGMWQFSDPNDSFYADYASRLVEALQCDSDVEAVTKAARWFYENHEVNNTKMTTNLISAFMYYGHHEDEDVPMVVGFLMRSMLDEPNLA